MVEGKNISYHCNFSSGYSCYILLEISNFHRLSKMYRVDKREILISGKKGFYKYLTPNSGLKFACFLHFSGVLEKPFTHSTEIKHTLAFCIGQKPPVVSARWDLTEPFGGFFCLICAFGKRGTLSLCERYFDAHLAAAGAPLGAHSDPRAPPALCPHTGRTPRARPPVVLLARPRGGIWGDKYGDAINACSRRRRGRLAGINLAAELCGLADGCRRSRRARGTSPPAQPPEQLRSSSAIRTSLSKQTALLPCFCVRWICFVPSAALEL